MNIIKSFSITLVMLGITNCGSSGRTVEVKKTSGYQQNHGPFDSNGNYVEKWADYAPKRKYVRGSRFARKTPPPKTYTPPVRRKTSTLIATNSSSSKVTSRRPYTPRKITKKISSSAKKTKTTAKKITPKSKPPAFHTVKKGDTLYGLSRRYGASVSAIQKANKLNGTNISIGKRLIIPRK